MIKIAICDDQEKERNLTRDMCNNYLTRNLHYDIRVSVFASSLELLQSIIKQECYDIILLDIYMPDMSGMELAKNVRNLDDKCQIVFLTTSSAHAVEAFSVHAVHYLVKPYSQIQLDDALDKAFRAIEKYNKAFITLKIPGGVSKVNFKDFYYSETQRHNQKLYLIDNLSLSVRMTSVELYELLAFDHRFFKCGSTYIINFDKVEEITTQYIAFDNGERLPMQRRHYKEMMEQYTRYSLEGI